MDRSASTHRSRRPALWVLATTAALLASAPLTAQQHEHPARLGTAHLETSCSSAVVPSFDRALVLLHSFEFGTATRAFEEVAATDPGCAMAWWGIALARWTNPMVPNIRPAAVLDRGREAAARGLQLAARATPRERAYLAAVAELYAEPATRDQRARLLAYERAMAAVADAHPTDREARIFHALAIVAAAPPTDKTYENQRRAGAMLEELFATQPDHPGLAHYIIHSYDVPALAARASDAASRYADIAPAAAHALHMPSHTFTRVGRWRESIATNLRSAEVAEREGSIAEALHALDYAVYAHLQLGEDDEAAALLRRLPALAARFDPRAVTGAAPGSAGVFALAAMPARHALERDDWPAAAALVPVTSEYPYAEALTHFARALGAARTGAIGLARTSADSLRAFHARLAAAKEAYWAEQVAIQELAVTAWIQHAEGHGSEALASMREAARREDATEKAAVTPGPLAPARELLGDLLMAQGQPVEALAAYRAALEREPNRRRSMLGARRAEAAVAR
jgi:tetratricopeptide (TPR) repeat protein